MYNTREERREFYGSLRPMDIVEYTYFDGRTVKSTILSRLKGDSIKFVRIDGTHGWWGIYGPMKMRLVERGCLMNREVLLDDI